MTTPRPSRQPGSDWGVAIPAFLIIAFGWLILCWPALVAHGYTDTGGWRWDIHSTEACAAWWGALCLFTGIAWASRRFPADKAPPAPALPHPEARRACRHLRAVPIDLYTGERVAYWCEQCHTQLDPGFRASELRKVTRNA